MSQSYLVWPSCTVMTSGRSAMSCIWQGQRSAQRMMRRAQFQKMKLYSRLVFEHPKSQTIGQRVVVVTRGGQSGLYEGTSRYPLVGSLLDCKGMARIM